MQPATPTLPNHIHFVGICGKAMMGLAAAVASHGVRVTGSDEKIYGGAAEWLSERGIVPASEFSASALDPAPDLVVIGRTYGRGNIEVETVLDRRLRHCSLPRFIADYFLGSARNLVVAGSKGKTTTTAMGAWILQCAGLNPGYLVAGSAPDLGEQAKLGDLNLHVLEGDDYSSLWCDDNPKFCYYRPEAVILTNVFADHPEHHTDAGVAARHFGKLVSLIPRSGLLVLGHENEIVQQVRGTACCPTIRVGLDDAADVTVEGWSQTAAGIEFNIDGVAFALPLFGRINALNAAMAAVAARHFGVTLETSAAALRRFHGVHGRMEHLGTAGGVACYTDMGYLPECMMPTIEALRHRHQGRRLVFLFQPHIIEGLPQSRQAVVKALSACDLVLLADVYRPQTYPATNPGFSDDLSRELASLGINTARIGPVEVAARNAVPHLQPDDVVLGIIHPKHCAELPRLVQLLGQGDPCAS